MEKGFGYLMKNLSDSVFEMMLKLNEDHSNSMCVYYTEDLAAYLLGVSEDMAFDKILKFPEYCEKELGSVTIDKASDGRFGIKVYSDGIIKIMESNPRRFFLKELIKKIRNRDCTIDDVKKIFEKESPNYVCDEIDNSEFQYVVYFLDKDIDEYKYCFTFDSMGSYYHRVIDYDYEKLIRHNCGL